MIERLLSQIPHSFSSSLRRGGERLPAETDDVRYWSPSTYDPTNSQLDHHHQHHIARARFNHDWWSRATYRASVRKRFFCQPYLETLEMGKSAKKFDFIRFYLDNWLLNSWIRRHVLTSTRSQEQKADKISIIMVVDPYGTGGTRSLQHLDRGTLSRMSPQYLRSTNCNQQRLFPSPDPLLCPQPWRQINAYPHRIIKKI